MKTSTSSAITVSGLLPIAPESLLHGPAIVFQLLDAILGRITNFTEQSPA
jgi:hypothetical protein